MNRAEMRKRERRQSTVAGDLEREISEVKKLSHDKESEIYTLTATCGDFLTIICC